mmetsp:Transcript_18049/g.41780  ORF Transcript_18049/g.41780 Transcript_18049/m.41780 type:complete len:110 (-) Transcript_18049:310-639(-)
MTNAFDSIVVYAKKRRTGSGKFAEGLTGRSVEWNRLESFVDCCPSADVFVIVRPGTGNATRLSNGLDDRVDGRRALVKVVNKKPSWRLNVVGGAVYYPVDANSCSMIFI